MNPRQSERSWGVSGQWKCRCSRHKPLFSNVDQASENSEIPVPSPRGRWLQQTLSVSPMLRPDTEKKLKLLDFGSLNNPQVTQPTAGMDFRTPPRAIGITLLHCSTFNKPWTKKKKSPYYSKLSCCVCVCMCVCMLSRFSWVWFFATLWTVPTRFLWPWDSAGKNTGVDCHALAPGDAPRPRPGIEPVSLMSPALADGFLSLAPPGKPSGLVSYSYYE